MFLGWKEGPQWLLGVEGIQGRGEQTARVGARARGASWACENCDSAMCLGRKGPGDPGLVASGTLSPPSQPCGNRGSARC